MINNSSLLGLFGTPGAATGGFGGGVRSPSRQRQPTPPWSTTVQATPPSDLVRTALGGRKLINESAVRLDATAASGDYRTLFSLYNGLETLSALVNRSRDKGVPATELTLLQRRFDAGLAEISSYLATSRLEDVRVVTGTAAATAK
ncbi:MAG: transcriptional regulator, partial [Brevundimonas sp.]